MGYAPFSNVSNRYYATSGMLLCLSSCNNALKAKGDLSVFVTATKAESVKEFETPLLKTIKLQQEYMAGHNISKIFCYLKPLKSAKDTFSLDEIQNFDREGKLEIAKWPNYR